MIPIFRWSGAYIGFLSAGWFFGADGRYLGWYDRQGGVWNRDGSYLGSIVEDNYILRRQGFALPVPKTPKVPPVNPQLPTPPGNRIPRTPIPGWVDALDRIGRQPQRDDLIGLWENRDDRLVLGGDLAYTLNAPGGTEQRGTWNLRGNLILTPQEVRDGEPASLVYRILEYGGDFMTLRRIALTERSLPFTLHRGSLVPD